MKENLRSAWAGKEREERSLGYAWWSGGKTLPVEEAPFAGRLLLPRKTQVVPNASCMFLLHPATKRPHSQPATSGRSSVGLASYSAFARTNTHISGDRNYCANPNNNALESR